MRFALALSGRLLALLVTLVILAAGFGMALVYSSLPDAREELAIPALAAPVSVTLDAHGIPRITATSERDAAVALGYLHARDRMFQMEAMRRGAEGRLAEIAGAPALRLDRFTRTLGLAQRAREDLAALSPEARDTLEAYASGVNALIAARGRLAAPEFMLIGEPEPWKPEHSLLWAKVMGLWLSGNWRRELEMSRLADTLSPERMRLLWPEDDSPGRPDLRATTTLDSGHLARVLAALPVFGQDAQLPSSASNAWAVTGAGSLSGAPLLASDPHLGFQAPILWYLTRIELPDGQFRAGATAPGVPTVVIGRNEHLAWGFTTAHSDTQDVFVDRLVGTDSYATPDGPRPFTIREERIAVRGQEAPEILRVRHTRHGPVISDLDIAAPAGTVLSVAMANLAPGDTSAEALIGLNRATTIAQARRAAAQMSSPPQNLMVADSAGGIAMYLVGRTPIRRAGDGTMPARGWDGSQDWLGFVPFDAMPHVENPVSGVVANANSRPAPADHPVFLGRDWYGDWRLRRIGELLAERPRHSAEHFAAMQNDTVSLFARELLPVLRAVTPSREAAAAHGLLRSWNGEMQASAPQPLIFHAWLGSFRNALMAEVGTPDAAAAAGPEFLRAVLRPGANAWCGAEGCARLLAPALDAALRGLRDTQGSDPNAWRWGAVHVAAFEHPLLRFIPVVKDLTRLEAATGGDGETLARGGMRGGSGSNPFAHLHGAGFRGVFDLADPDGALVMIGTGQSGHMLSDRFADLLPRWQAGEMLRLTRLPARESGRIELRP